jgi:RNA polymerase sigma-70 factor (ECF subfamily)
MLQQVNLLSKPTGVTDQVLVRQTLTGDEYAFETLVRRYQLQIFRFISRHLDDYDQACDVFQQVLLKLSTSLPTLCTARESLGPWLYHIARNCCIDELRKRRVVRFSELGWKSVEDLEELLPSASVMDPGLSPEETVERDELQRTLRVAIEGLPPRWRSVVLLRYMDQLSFSEIGRLLKMSTSTAKSCFNRSCPLLRAILTVQLQADSTEGWYSRTHLPRKQYD